MIRVGVALEAAWSELDDPVQEIHMAVFVGTDGARFLALEVLGQHRVRRRKAPPGTPAPPKSSLHTASMYW